MNEWVIPQLSVHQGNLDLQPGSRGHSGARGKSGESHLSPRGGREVRNVKTEGHPRQARKGPGGGKGLSGTKKPLQRGKQERTSE